MNLRNYNVKMFLVVIILISGKLIAQDTSKSILMAKKFAVQFQVTGLFNFRAFEGNVLSAKYNFNEKNSLRFGISFYGDNSSTKKQIKEENLIAENDLKSELYSLSLSMHYLRNKFLFNEMYLFYGLGPNIYISSSNYEYSREKGNSFNIGTDFLGGIEWFFYKNFSLSGEYGFKIYYEYYKNEKIEGNNRFITTITKGINTIPIDVKIGLSVYF